MSLTALDLSPIDRVLSKQDPWDTSRTRPLAQLSNEDLENAYTESLIDRRPRSLAASAFEMGRRQFGKKSFNQGGLPYYSSGGGYRGGTCHECGSETEELRLYYFGAERSEDRTFRHE